MLPYQINTILVPIDMSETSLNALDTAVVLARRHKASLIVLNVIETGFDFLLEGGGFSSFNKLSNSADVLTALMGGIQHTHGIEPRLIQEEGYVTHSILKTALIHQVDLIVIGTHGASGYRDGFIGTNAYSVIKHSTSPVLTIPPKRKWLTFRNAMFPIRPVSGALSRIDVACQFLNTHATLDVLGLSYRKMERDTNVLEKILEEVKKPISEQQIEVNLGWGNGETISEDILDHVHEHASDLIVLTPVIDVTTKPNFVGPHSQRILNSAKIPVLNIKKVGVPFVV